MHPKEKRRRVTLMFTALGSNNYRLNRSTGKIILTIPKKRGAPYGNSNAVGNKGGGAPLGNLNAEKHGLYTNLGYRWRMMEIEQLLIGSGQYSVELVRGIAEKVKTSQAVTFRYRLSQSR